MDLPDEFQHPAIPQQTVSTYGHLSVHQTISRNRQQTLQRDRPCHTLRKAAMPMKSGVLLNTDEHAADSDVFSAERILRRRTRNGREEFLVKWVGYPHRYNTRKPAS